MDGREWISFFCSLLVNIIDVAILIRDDLGREERVYCDIIARGPY